MNAETSIERCVTCRGTSADAAIAWNYIPVPSFGNLTHAKVATIGLNPALNELRLPMPGDYRKQFREELTDRDVMDCSKSGEGYFTASEDWHNYFVTLDAFLGRVNHLWSYGQNAAHIDLVACPTKKRFGETSKESQAALIGNCRLHFLKTLTQLPENTILLLDGRTVCDNFAHSGELSFDAGPELVLISPKVEGLRGSVTIKGRQFKFRGWNLPVGKLTPLQRMELSIWLRKHSA